MKNNALFVVSLSDATNILAVGDVTIFGEYSMQGKRKYISHQWKGWRLLEYGD
jgi:hypothetical protein